MAYMAENKVKAAIIIDRGLDYNFGNVKLNQRFIPPIITEGLNPSVLQF
jgi:hypothetical protein